MKTQWIRRRWLVAGTSSVAGLVLLATVVLYTNIGAPRDEHASMPHPCHLVEGSIQEQLAGEVRLSQILNTGPGSTRLGLDRDTAERTCHGGPVGAYDGSVLVSVLLFYSAQFGLGRTGEEKAVDQLAIHNRLFSDRSRMVASMSGQTSVATLVACIANATCGCTFNRTTSMLRSASASSVPIGRPCLRRRSGCWPS